MSGKFTHQAWVVTVDMGYGHQRASYPLKHLAYKGKIISANNYEGIPERDKDLWSNSKTFYEFVSRFKKVPFIGERIWRAYDKLQRIPNFYPRRDLSKPSLQVKQIYNLFKAADWGKHLINKLNKKPLSLITTFFATAFMAEYFGYRGDIFCLATDTDISRTWVPLEPKMTKINYLAPNKRVVERLKLYGIKEKQIYLTGFPLPDENVGKNSSIVKQDLGARLPNLDPQGIYISQYEKTLLRHVGRANLKYKPTRPLTITFAVGGAGAQREIGGLIMASLKEDILSGKIKMNLIAGTHLAVNKYYQKKVQELELGKELGKNINVLYVPSKMEYFKRFSRVLKTTDILWTKPSELSFYCALGLPIIMAPPIGSQEVFNQKWLTSIGAGIKQENPNYTNEWLFDWLSSGWLAEAAMQGFLEAPMFGTYNVEKIVFHEHKKAKKVKTVLQY